VGEDAREVEGPLEASSEAHARQQGRHGVGEDVHEVEGPLDAPSEAHARHQGLPGVGEDAHEVEGPLEASSDAEVGSTRLDSEALGSEAEARGAAASGTAKRSREQHAQPCEEDCAPYAGSADFAKLLQNVDSDAEGPTAGARAGKNKKNKAQWKRAHGARCRSRSGCTPSRRSIRGALASHHVAVRWQVRRVLAIFGAALLLSRRLIEHGDSGELLF
jgi:hypothetical protein